MSSEHFLSVLATKLLILLKKLFCNESAQTEVFKNISPLNSILRKFSELDLGSWNFERRFTSPHLSCATRLVSHVMCNESHFTCHIAHVIFFYLFETKCWNLLVESLFSLGLPCLIPGGKLFSPGIFKLDVLLKMSESWWEPPSFYSPVWVVFPLRTFYVKPGPAIHTKHTLI